MYELYELLYLYFMAGHFGFNLVDVAEMTNLEVDRLVARQVFAAPSAGS
jgi:hypothetical protein